MTLVTLPGRAYRWLFLEACRVATQASWHGVKPQYRRTPFTRDQRRLIGAGFVLAALGLAVNALVRVAPGIKPVAEAAGLVGVVALNASIGILVFGRQRGERIDT